MTLDYSTVIRVLDADAVTELIQVLIAERGTHEENGPNDGTCLKYQKVTGNGRGDSWCLSFLMWGVLQVVGAMQALREVVGIVTGSCEQLRQVASKRGQLMPVGTEPQSGDIGLIVNTAANHAHHAYLVEGRSGMDGSRETIEGNSNDTGGSNGDGTYIRNSRFGPSDPCIKSGSINHYELVRISGLAS